MLSLNQSFADLPHRPVLVDLTVEEGQRLKVIYGSCAGFHAIDVDSGNNYDIYIPVHVSWNLEGCDLEEALPDKLKWIIIIKGFHFLDQRPVFCRRLFGELSLPPPPPTHNIKLSKTLMLCCV